MNQVNNFECAKCTILHCSIIMRELSLKRLYQLCCGKTQNDNPVHTLFKKIMLIAS